MEKRFAPIVIWTVVCIIMAVLAGLVLAVFIGIPKAFQFSAVGAFAVWVAAMVGIVLGDGEEAPEETEKPEEAITGDPSDPFVCPNPEGNCLGCQCGKPEGCQGGHCGNPNCKCGPRPPENGC